MLPTRRLFTLVTCVLLLAAFGCRRGQPETTEEPTEEPSPTPAVESLGEFQLVGTVQQAFLDVIPNIDIPEGEQPPLEEGTAGRESTNVPGVMRVSLEAFSDNMRDRCSADPEDRFNVYWTTNTLFDPVYVEATDIETRLEGRELGIIGTVYERPADTGGEEFEFDSPAPDQTGEATTAPPASSPQAEPGASDLEGEDTCVLIAEQVGTSTGELPTPGPRRSPTPTTRPSPTPTRRPVTDTAGS